MVPWKIGLEGVDWIYLAQDKDRCRVLVNTIIKLVVTQNAENFLTSCVTVSFLRTAVLPGVT
jgi:hypothetical protein